MESVNLQSLKNSEDEVAVIIPVKIPINMGIVALYYKLRHPDVSVDRIPARYKVSLWGGVKKLFRKWFSAVLIPSIPFNNIRVNCYRMCGYKIGKGSFIGMRCYLDDLCYDKIEIGRNVTISYGVYFACHGRKQGHNSIVIRDGAYIGMHCSIIAPKDIEIGEMAIIGTHSLVNRSVKPRQVVGGVPARPLHNQK